MNQFPTYRDNQLCTDGSVASFYEREFFVFSNFSSFQVEWMGKLWPTSEHAYQAARYIQSQPEFVERVRAMKSAHEAYRFMQAHRDEEQSDWRDVKRDVMKDIVRCKLEQHTYIQQKLLETGNARIVEDSPKDPYWGWGENRTGRNELGTIWMELREELRDGKIKQL